jgi:broad specificity phosphatase PhoE
MIVYLVRHGYSEANAALKVTGTIADELHNCGQEQSLRLSQWLAEAGVFPDVFWVSQWTRAQQTAQLLYPEANWIVDSRLGETDAGAVADSTLESFLSSWPDFHDSPRNLYPDGESHMMLNERVLAWWEDLKKSDAGVVMVVAHSGPISCILQHVISVDMSRFPSFLPANASVSIVDCVIEKSPISRCEYRLKGFSLGPLHNLQGVFKQR